MGQRHQLFVIANIIGRYRVLAVLHDQWLYGYSAIRQSLHVVTIFKAKADQPHLLHELKKAERIDWETEIYEDDGEASATVFPFNATCLALGTAINDENARVSSISLMPIDTPYNGVQNDDGLSIIEIGSANRRHVFVALWDTEISLRSELSETYLLSPRNYIKIYYSEDDMKRLGFLDDVAQLESAPGSLTDDSEEESCVRAISNTSLKDLSLSKVIDEALNSEPGDLSWLPHAEQLPDFLPALLERLRRDPSLLKSSSGIPLLRRTFKGCDVIYLTYFSELNTHEVKELFQENATKSLAQAFKQLILPDIEDLTLDVIKDILSRHRFVELHFGDTKHVLLEEMLESIAGTTVQKLTCTALYKQPLQAISDGFPLRLKDIRASASNSPCGSRTGFPLPKLSISASPLSKALQDLTTEVSNGHRTFRRRPPKLGKNEQSSPESLNMGLESSSSLFKMRSYLIAKPQSACRGWWGDW